MPRVRTAPAAFERRAQTVVHRRGGRTSSAHGIRLMLRPIPAIEGRAHDQVRTHWGSSRCRLLSGKPSPRSRHRSLPARLPAADITEKPPDPAWSRPSKPRPTRNHEPRPGSRLIPHFARTATPLRRCLTRTLDRNEAHQRQTGSHAGGKRPATAVLRRSCSLHRLATTRSDLTPSTHCFNARSGAVRRQLVDSCKANRAS
jgi:hypothetical protein